MKARIYPEDDYWIVAGDDEPYVDGPFIEIPDDLGGAMRAAQDQWDKASKAFSAWVENHIKEQGGEDYRDYITGELSESQWRARAARCEHPNTVEIGGEFTRVARVECPDCGRRYYAERWL